MDIGVYKCPACGEVIEGESVGDPTLGPRIADHQRGHEAEVVAVLRKTKRCWPHGSTAARLAGELLLALTEPTREQP